MMKTCFRLLTPLLAFFIAFCSILPSAAFAKAGERLTKEYEFKTEDRDALYYPALEEIEMNGDIYRLVDVSYDIVDEKEPVSIEKRVKTWDPDDYDRTITKTIDGICYTLEAEEPDWKKKEIPHPTKTITREYAGTKSPPAQITEDGETYRIEHQEKKNRKESFHAPAVFYAETTDTTLYWFNGKIVEITGTQPIWNGYEADIRDYLNLNGNSYSITGMTWNGSFEQAENGYVRRATVNGQKAVSYQSVTYVNDVGANDVYEYTARIRYVDRDAKTEYTARATAVYEKVEKGLSKRAMLMIGAGAAVLCLAFSVLLFFLARRRAGEEGE